MSRCKQILSSCSPLQRVTQVNDVIFNGMQSLQLRFASSKKSRSDDDKSMMSDQCKHNACNKMGSGSSKCVVPPKGQIDDNNPGCMPFTDCVPIKPFYECEPPKEMKKCSKNKFTIKKPKNPCDPNANSCK